MKEAMARAVQDRDFRSALLSDPQGALGSMGVSASEDQLLLLRSLDSADFDNLPLEELGGPQRYKTGCIIF